MSTILIEIALFLMILASITDFLYYRIPNCIVGLLLILYPLFTFSLGLPFTFHPYLLFLIVLICGFALFYFGLIGGGDAKFLSVTALWIGWSKILSFLFFVGLIGGLLGIILMVMPKIINVATKRIRNFLQKQRLLSPIIKCLTCGNNKEVEKDILAMQKARMVPYAIAITAAAILLL